MQTTEDLWIEELLDGLEEDLGPEGGDRGGPADERRALLETLGLIAWELDPVAPSPAVRESLLARVAAEGSPASGAEPVALDPRAAAAPIPGSRTRWALPLAASLTALLLGLSGWQSLRLEEQGRTIARLTGQLEEAAGEAARTAHFRQMAGDAAAKLALVTASGVEICTLRPVGREPVHPASRGVLFVAADHQHWYLKIEGLEPCPQGRSYQLWFITGEAGPVSGGTFDVETGIEIELSSETMPAGTRAVSVTLEPAGGSDLPSGPEVLFGDQVMRVL